NQNRLTTNAKKMGLSLTFLVLGFALAIGINQALAAPTATPPNSNVTPNFEGINLNGGTINLKNTSNQNTIDIIGSGTANLGGINFYDAVGSKSIVIRGDIGEVMAKQLRAPKLFTDYITTQIENVFGTDNWGKITQKYGTGGYAEMIFTDSGSEEKLKLESNTGNITSSGNLTVKGTIKTDKIETLINSMVEFTKPVKATKIITDIFSITADIVIIEKDETTNSGKITIKDNNLWPGIILDGKTQKISATNITASNIGKIYYLNSGWKSQSIPSGSSQATTIYCNAGHSVTGCHGYLWPSVVGVYYVGGYPYGSNGCASNYYNTTGVTANIWVQDSAFCFDPTSN
ncbi:hypothetical protein KKG71_06505, partial [Patescibacteria group bacterium]|nr:hypothetical protein [Patescibacteria group bacterium]